MKKRIYDYLTMVIDTDEYDFKRDLDDLFINISEKFGLEFYETKFLVFSYIVEVLKTDPTDDYRIEDWLYKVPQNLKLPFLKESVWYENHFISNSSFKDVKKVGDRLLLEVDGWFDFVECFDNKSLAEEILSEDWFELFSLDSNSIDLKNDVFDNLDKKSIDRLMDKVKEFKGHELENMGDYDNFSEDGEDPELTDELINKISSDINMLHDLIKNCEFFNDLKYDLYNSYSNAYNNAAEGELFKSLSDEIKSFFGDGGKWDSYKITKNNEEKTKNVLVFDITDKFYDIIDNMLIDLERNPYDESSYFLRVLEIYLYESNQKFDTPDTHYYYPDSRTVEKYLNEYIIDNI